MPEPGGQLIPFNEASLEIMERKARIDGTAVVQSANMLVVNDPGGYALAGELRKEVNEKDGVLEREFKPIKQAMDAAKKKILDFEKRAREPFQKAREIIDGKILTFRMAQEQIRREEEDRLRREAQRREDDRKMREAEAAVKEGATQAEALEIIERPSTAPAPVVPLDLPKIAGLSVRKAWKARVVNFPALLMFAAMHPEMAASLVVANEPGLNALARSQKEALAIDGVEAYVEEGVAGSRS